MKPGLNKFNFVFLTPNPLGQSEKTEKPSKDIVVTASLLVFPYNSHPFSHLTTKNDTNGKNDSF